MRRRQSSMSQWTAALMIVITSLVLTARDQRMLEVHREAQLWHRYPKTQMVRRWLLATGASQSQSSEYTLLSAAISSFRFSLRSTSTKSSQWSHQPQISAKERQVMIPQPSKRTFRNAWEKSKGCLNPLLKAAQRMVFKFLMTFMSLLASISC